MLDLVLALADHPMAAAMELELELELELGPVATECRLRKLSVPCC